MEENSTQPGSPAAEQEQTLTISPEEVCFIIIKAKEYDAKDKATEPEPALPMTRTLRFLKSTKMILSWRNSRRSSIHSPKTSRSIL